MTSFTIDLPDELFTTQPANQAELTKIFNTQFMLRAVIETQDSPEAVFKCDWPVPALG